MNRKSFSMLLLAAVLFAGAIVAPGIGRVAPCDPKTDPGCGNREAVALVAPCDPKTDPGCNNREAVALVAPCDPKTDPGCKN